MSTVTPPGPEHTQTGGAICPTCRLAADLEIDHVCITRGGRLGPLFEHDIDGQRLIDELEAHPARPLLDGPPARVRAVDRTWCVCACGPSSRAATP